MAKKAYRELSEAERKRHSLSARVSRYVVIGAAILGVTMLIIGLARQHDTCQGGGRRFL